MNQGSGGAEQPLSYFLKKIYLMQFLENEFIHPKHLQNCVTEIN
jgi:hypothetical protein